ncbi:unnamed protein product [Eruca vesicaria subsp. sativa]|uniref:Uncharacterized protein n=1 Tax=Eruca vesicaria subsp. sativa TaxID=29727 RepID=A0ABC8K0S6_ERUVS|nr:unnamed protein product [Eruca vesicaria subsp. sativa]
MASFEILSEHSTKFISFLLCCKRPFKIVKKNSTIITVYPQVLIIADSFGPKLQFLKSRGASASELTKVLSKVPKILGSKKDKALSTYYDFVKDIIEADKSYKFKKLCLSFLLPHGCHQENKIMNISVLRELGMPQKLLFSLLTSKVQLVCGKDKFEESLKKRALLMPGGRGERGNASFKSGMNKVPRIAENGEEDPEIVKEARKLFDEFEKGSIPSLLTYNTLIFGMCEKGDVIEAGRLWGGLSNFSLKGILRRSTIDHLLTKVKIRSSLSLSLSADFEISASNPTQCSGGSKHLTLVGSEESLEPDGDETGYINQTLNEESDTKNELEPVTEDFGNSTLGSLPSKSSR